MQKSRKWKAIIMARDGSCGSSGMELNRQIFIVGYLQFVGRKRLHCSTVFDWKRELRQWQENRKGVCPWVAQSVRTEGKRWRNPFECLERPWGFQEVVAPRFQDNRHMNVVRLLALRTGSFTNQEIFLVLISVRGCLNPRTIVRQERL